MIGRFGIMFSTLSICAVYCAPAVCSSDSSQTSAQQAIGAASGKIINMCRSDLDGDHAIETIVITCTGNKSGHPIGGDVVVLREAHGKLRSVWRQRSLNPWKLQIADVDGDKKREIVLGVWKKSPKDPVMAKRVFVYSWNGKRMLPKWLGSRLSRRFDDFALADINKDGWDELLALEVAPKGQHRISAYRWLSFGFEWIGGSSDATGLVAVSNYNGRAFAIVGGKRVSISLLKGRIILTR